MADLKSALKEAAIQIGAGGSAGFVEICIMHPLDLIKTRLQLQSSIILGKDDPKYYSGVFDCIRKMYKYEGVTSYWKGIIPPIIAETPKRAVKFFSFEQFKQFFLFGSPTPTPLTFSLAGFGAGIAEGMFVNPFEVVKVTMQANRAVGTEVPSTWVVTREIVSKHGFGSRGLLKGVIATIWRNGVFNTIYFGFYHSVKGYLPEYQDPLQEFFRKISIGFVSGTLGCCVNIPFDVAKSRIQGPQPIANQIKYKGVFQSIYMIYKEESIVALYKGIVPKVMRLGPGGAIMLVVYEHSHNYLTNKFK